MLFRLASLAATLMMASTVYADGAVTQTIAYVQPTQSCVSGAHMIVARASTEPLGLGILEGVTSMIQKMVPNSDAVAVVYPATLDDYVQSEQSGVVGMKQLVTNYVEMCPNGKIVLLGYSQGAQVVGDSLIGSRDNNFSDDSTNPTGLGTNYLNQIAAIIMMGDPSFTVGTPGHVGNASKDGLFSRQNVDAYTQYSLNNKMQTYCDANDLYCASGSGNDALSIHESYVGLYGQAAASYVANIFGGSSSSSSGSGSSSASSGGGSSSQAASSSSSAPASTQSSNNNSGGSSSKASSAAAMTSSTSTMTNNPLTSNRFHPYTGTMSGTFAQPGNLANLGGIHTMDRGIAGTVFGAAMFVMGML